MWAIAARPDDPVRYCETGQSGRLKSVVTRPDTELFFRCGFLEQCCFSLSHFLAERFEVEF